MSRTTHRSAKLAAAVFGALALAGWPLHASAQQESAPEDAAQEELRVMPMGSSTVAGSTPGGFRVDLWQLLVADGWSVDFVGSQSDTSTPIGDPDHEGPQRLSDRRHGRGGGRLG